jgi:PAS domain-containing protein
MNAVSANVERLLGYPRAEWLEPGFWAAHLHPDDRARTVEACLASTARLEDHKLEYRFLARDGRTVWLRDEAKVILGDDAVAVAQAGAFFVHGCTVAAVGFERKCGEILLPLHLRRFYHLPPGRSC